ncbi:hypothetical protein [Pseudonocardia lacus]|uniref:hypothetical protein n=1 Tax=Pseudonocardia lacus TaxID=2835865 RepID=UPI001BDBF983|nr:hypothetical protein [Pseudonocardia lacus]
MEGLTPRPPNSSAALLRATDHARVLLRRAQVLLAVFAVLVAVAIGLLAAASRAAAPPAHLGAVVEPPPTAAGLVAGIGTLAVCWGLLALAGAIWRARLAAHDRRALAREWARVEPVWSHRRV